MSSTVVVSAKGPGAISLVAVVAVAAAVDAGFYVVVEVVASPTVSPSCDGSCSRCSGFQLDIISTVGCVALAGNSNLLHYLWSCASFALDL